MQIPRFPLRSRARPGIRNAASILALTLTLGLTIAPTGALGQRGEHGGGEHGGGGHGGGGHEGGGHEGWGRGGGEHFGGGHFDGHRFDGGHDGWHGDRDHWRHGWGGWGGYWGPGWYPGWSFGMGYYDPFWDPAPPSYYAPPPTYAPAPPVYGPPPVAAPAPSSTPAFYGWPVGIQNGTCDRDYLAHVAGGVTGVSVTGPEGGATLGGVFVGPLVRGPISARMDLVDHACVMQTLEFARTGKSVRWRLSDGTPMRVETTRTFYREDGEPCRDYLVTARINGREQTIPETACRSPYGSWSEIG